MNTYELAAKLQTTGWNSQQDVNGRNFYGMTPAQVAAQAGNVEEFRAITSDATFDPEKMGVVHTFFKSAERHRSRTTRQSLNIFSMSSWSSSSSILIAKYSLDTREAPRSWPPLRCASILQISSFPICLVSLASQANSFFPPAGFSALIRSSYE
jgi:hypothetical protein